MSTFKTALRVFIVMILLTGGIYPLLVTVIAELLMPWRAHGMLLQENGTIVGSSLIAQEFVENQYFWPRPSTINYDPIAPSGGSNLGPINATLKEIVEERRKKLGNAALPELVYASASGLDPHISIKAAYAQISRVAKARSIDEEELTSIIASFIEGKQWGFLGPEYINVLLLNQALDERSRR